MAEGPRRLLAWLGTLVVALTIGQGLIRHLALFPACLLLLGLISLVQAALGQLLLPTRAWALSDLSIEVIQGLSLGGVLALVLILTRTLIGAAPSPLIPALVWPTVRFWPESPGRINLRRFGAPAPHEGGTGRER